MSKPPVDGVVDFIEPQYLERATISLTISTEITYKQGDFYGAISKAQEAIGFDLYDSVLIRLDRIRHQYNMMLDLIRHQYKMMHQVDRDDAVLKGLDDLIGSLREPFPSGDA